MPFFIHPSLLFSLQNNSVRQSPHGPVVRTLSFHCQGPGSIPGRGTKSPHMVLCSQIKNSLFKNSSVRPGSGFSLFCSRVTEGDWVIWPKSPSQWVAEPAPEEASHKSVSLPVIWTCLKLQTERQRQTCNISGACEPGALNCYTVLLLSLQVSAHLHFYTVF